MKKIAASILGKDDKAKLINTLIERGIDSIHYDVMDGNFVDNHSLPIAEVLELFNNTNDHYKDVHLMVQKPSKYLDELIDKTDQVSVHVESKFEDSLEKLVDKYHNQVKLGLVVNPDTNIEKVFPYLDKLNHVMIMSVVPGKGGQTFIESSLEKISKIKKYITDNNIDLILEIDGGINNVWGPKVFEKGINIAVSGSYLINNIDDNSIGKILGK